MSRLFFLSCFKLSTNFPPFFTIHFIFIHKRRVWSSSNYWIEALKSAISGFCIKNYFDELDWKTKNGIFCRTKFQRNELFYWKISKSERNASVAYKWFELQSFSDHFCLSNIHQCDIFANWHKTFTHTHAHTMFYKTFSINLCVSFQSSSASECNVHFIVLILLVFLSLYPVHSCHSLCVCLHL